ncbi:MAG: hypothetical protein ACTSVV_10255 [Promethearchaeota archaeon]
MNNTILEYPFKGKIIKERNYVENLNFKFFLDQIYPRKISGYIIGTKATYKELSEFADKLQFGDSSFSIKGLTEDGRSIEIKECYLRKIEKIEFPIRIYELEREVAELEAYDFKIERKYEKIPKDFLSLSIIFKLDNRGILNLAISRSEVFNFDGSIKIDDHFDPNKIDTEIGLLSFSQRFNFLDITINQRKGEYRYYSNAAIIEIESVKSNKYNEKIDEAKELVEDYLYLISFISRKWVRWNQYTSFVTTNDKKEIIAKQEYFQKGYYPEEDKERIENFIIEPENLSNFLEISYPIYKNKKDYLKSILAYYITSQEEKLMESAFLMLCITIEALIYQYSEHEGASFIMNKNQFKKLSRLLKQVISEFSRKENIDKELIFNKLPELKRRPIRSSLKLLIEKYNIYIKDLYPDAKKEFKFLELRNKLLHQGKISNYYELFKEKMKLQYLVERIILRMLGWGREKGSTSDFPIFRFLS